MEEESAKFWKGLVIGLAASALLWAFIYKLIDILI
jgi:hypothetical protein